MKVTLVAPHDTGQPTGILTYVQELAARSPPAVEVDVRHLGKNEFVVAGRAVGGTLSTWASLATLRLGPDAGVVHATDTFCLARGSRVLTMHDRIPATVRRHVGARWHERLFRRRLQRVERIITPTRVVAADVESMGLGAGIDVIPMGFDQALFRPATRPVPAGFAPGRRNILMVGAWRPYKHFDLVIEALAGTPWRLVRVGPPGKDAYHARCQKMAREGEVDLADVGYVAATDLPAYYGSADLLLYPSASEGFGIPPLEAMGCGTPSLLADIPVLREVCGNAAHYAGDLRAPALRESIARALDDPIPKARLAERAALYSWDATARRTYALYEELGPLRSARP
ncbi:MAG: glycosyltransferase family 4 protein [Thermoplasmatota archaeon]